MEALAFAIIGLLAGIGVNVLADRLPAGLGVAGLWVCPSCHRSLSVRQGIGLSRALFGANRCPACQTDLPFRHLAVEIAMTGLFAFLWWRHGLSPALALNSLFLVFFVLIFVVDLEHRLVLNVVVAPAAGLAILTALVRPGLSSALIGGAVGFGLLLVFHFVYPKGLGAGDVKLAGFIGLVLGWPTILSGLFLGFAMGALVSVALLATKRVSLKSYIPYAPFLVVGAFAMLVLSSS